MGMNLHAFSLADRVAIVTGGGRGLGKVMALALAEAGADVAVAARTEEEIGTTASEISRLGRRAFPVVTDVTVYSRVEAMAKEVVAGLGRIDVLVNNAAVIMRKPLLETTEEEWQQVIQTNLTGTFFCCKAVAPFMVKQGGGKIINLTSAGGISGRPYFAGYCASKGGVILLTKTLALEWAKYCITVNAIAPGYFKTALVASDYEKAAEKKLIDRIPLGRPGRPEEIGPLIVYLASSASDYITGETIVIDGGVLAY